MNYLALDTATRSGWALRNELGQIHSGVQIFDVRRGESPGMRWLRFESWLNEMLQTLRRNDNECLIVYEAAHHRGGAATAVGVGFTTIIHKLAAHYQCETMPVHTQTLKKFATGSGRASKEDMIDAANKHLPMPPMLSLITDDNQADALHLLSYAMSEIRQ